MKIDKQLETIQRKTILMFNMGIDIKTLLKASNTKIKQSILKAIMEAKPKKDIPRLGSENQDEYVIYSNGFNNALQEFESVIKQLLGENK